MHFAKKDSRSMDADEKVAFSNTLSRFGVPLRVYEVSFVI
jgi:hypothetical protein